MILTISILIGLSVIRSAPAFYIAPTGVLRNYNQAELWVNGFVVCYDQPYSDATTEEDLAACADASWVFVGAKASSSAANFLIGAYGFASEVFTKTTFANAAYEHNGLYWYMKAGASFGFSATSDVLLVDTDTLTNHNNRLSWRYDKQSSNGGGGRAAQFLELNEGSSYRKIVYRLRPGEASPTQSPTVALPLCSVPNEAYLGDGFCDVAPYNTAACGYDRGDCCRQTCISAEYECGFNGYTCIQPSETFPTLSPAAAPQAPTQPPTVAPSAPTVEPTFAPSAPTVEPTVAPSLEPTTSRPTLQPSLRGTSSSIVTYRFESSFPYGRDEDSYYPVEFPNMASGDEKIYYYLTTITFSQSTKLREDLDYITIYTDDRLSEVYGEPQYSGTSFPGMNGNGALGFRAFRFVLHFHSGPGEVPADNGYMMNVVMTRYAVSDHVVSGASSSSSYLGMSRSGMIGLITFLVISSIVMCCALPYWWLRSHSAAKVAAETRDRRKDRVKNVRNEEANLSKKKVKLSGGKKSSSYLEEVDPGSSITTVVKFEDDPPQQYMCSISCELMSDPVICADGFTYDRESIELWLSTHNTSPMTNIPLANKNLIPNQVLKDLIVEYKNKVSSAQKEKV